MTKKANKAVRIAEVIKSRKAQKAVEVPETTTIETPEFEQTDATTTVETPAPVVEETPSKPVELATKHNVFGMMSIGEFLPRFKNGDFNTEDAILRPEVGWRGFNCKTKSLINKTKILGTKLTQIAASTKKFDIEKTCAIFENLASVSGRSYETISICDIETGDVLYIIAPFEPKPGAPATVYDIVGSGNSDAVVSGLWIAVKKYFN